ncbi:MAG: hypothetical protein K8R90_10320, partial [Candidatus Cloacimonetes bacterium]|nr:hypothetical protein [Candidatus Cloacimonadota bacterium]
TDGAETKLSETGIKAEEIRKLAPVLVDFADANASTGMSVASAFDLMGRALNGHTEMLGRYGLELDKTKIEQACTACSRTRTPRPRLRALTASCLENILHQDELDSIYLQDKKERSSYLLLILLILMLTIYSAVLHRRNPIWCRLSDSV